MNKRKIRENRQTKKQQQKKRSLLIWGGIILVVVVLIAFILWDAFRPSAGEIVPIMSNASDHVQEGFDPGSYNSDPPTSGPHYAEEFDAGFYDVNSPEAQVPYPDGYLVHNLEHGYVIYWYNCELLVKSECDTLKKDIQESMNNNGSRKLIAFPRVTLDMPVVLTSWGQMLRMENFNARDAKNFVSTNLNRAPEPNAP